MLGAIRGSVFVFEARKTLESFLSLVAVASRAAQKAWHAH
jgi:hypothetical protein